MKILLLSLLFITSTQASLFKKSDKKNNCERYSVVSKKTNDQGVVTYSREIESGEVEFLNSPIVGMTLDKLTINFENQSVQAEVWLKRFLIRTPLLGRIKEPSPVSMTSTNVQFDDFINSLNSDLKLINDICITEDNEVKYIKFLKLSKAN